MANSAAMAFMGAELFPMYKSKRDREKQENLQGYRLRWLRNAGEAGGQYPLPEHPTDLYSKAPLPDGAAAVKPVTIKKPNTILAGLDDVYE